MMVENKLLNDQPIAKAPTIGFRLFSPARDGAIKPRKLTTTPLPKTKAPKSRRAIDGIFGVFSKPR
jgi:hypothetical protein